MLRNWELDFELRKCVANFRTYFRVPISKRSSLFCARAFSKYKSTEVTVKENMERNYFTQQGKAIPIAVRKVIIDKWLTGWRIFEVAQQLNINRNTVVNVVDRYLTTGNIEPGVGGNRSRTARTDDVILYTEFCKKEKPTMYAKEIQKQLVDNNVVNNEHSKGKFN